MSNFEQVRDDLEKLYHLLVHGEPTPDEESESKNKILEYLTVILQSPEGDGVKDLVQQAITLANNWDVYDLWFKEVKELPGIVGKILGVLKPSATQLLTAPPEKPAEKIAEKIELTSAPPERPTVKTAPEPAAGANIEDIIAKVTDQFKSQIQELKGKITSLEKNLDDKDQDLEKSKPFNGKSEPTPSSGIESTHLKPKLRAPKVKLPPIQPQKPLPPRVEEKPVAASAAPVEEIPNTATPAPVEEVALAPTLKPLVVKPIAIKPLIIAPSVVEKPAPAQLTIPKPVPVRQMIPKPVSIKPVAVLPEAEAEPADLQPIPVQVSAVKPVAQGIAIKPISVQRGGFKPISANVAAIEDTESSMGQETPRLQPISPRPIGIKPVNIGPGSPKQIFIKPVGIQPQPVVPQPVPIKSVSVQPVSVQPVAGPNRPVSVTPTSPVVIKPISAQPVGIKPISTIPSSSSGSNLANTLSSIGRTPAPTPESMISVRPVAATPAPTAAGLDLNGTLPESKTDLYSELIALEGRRFATERRKKEIDEQREKGQIGQPEYQASVARAELDLQGIASRINSIRQKLSTL